MLDTFGRRTDHDGRRLVAGIGQLAFRAGPDTQHIVAQQTHTHDGTRLGRQVPVLAAGGKRRRRAHAAQLAQRGGQGGTSGQGQRGGSDCGAGESLHKPALHARFFRFDGRTLEIKAKKVNKKKEKRLFMANNRVFIFRLPYIAAQ